MHDEEITIDDAVYMVRILSTEAGLQMMWACKSCGCGECCPISAPEPVAIQLAKAIVEEHHRLHHALRTVVHRLTWATG